MNQFVKIFHGGNLHIIEQEIQRFITPVVRIQNIVCSESIKDQTRNHTIIITFENISIKPK